MTKNSEKISLYKIVKSLSYSMDLISETIVGHHKKVTYIALQLGKELNLKNKDIKKLLISSLIHDLGVFYLNQSFSDLNFDNKNNEHAEIGYQLLKNNFPINDVAKIVKYHHHEWDYENNKNIPLLSNILHLADRITVLINDKSSILTQKKKIEKIINENSGKRFYPEAVEKFLLLSKKEYFWLDVISSIRIEKEIDSFFQPHDWNISYEKILKISNLISHIIDFRSSFTATHSQGISATSSHLSKYFNFNKKDQIQMKIAGYLHDIGKLNVPPHILNKTAKLNKQEWDIMKTHSYYTYQALSTSKNLDKIKQWASFHHEKLNGQGYPFHLKKNNLSLGSRIMAVADVFTAITEDRPYRKGMPYDKVKKILDEMVKSKELDEKITGTVIDNLIEFNTIREESQLQAKQYFDKFNDQTSKILGINN